MNEDMVALSAITPDMEETAGELAAAAVLLGRHAREPAVSHKRVITEAGVYDGLSDEEYHADPVPGGSLSSSGARLLLPPSAPALFDHYRRHGRPPKREWDLGQAAHSLVLGVGRPIRAVGFDDWRTKDAQAARKAAYAAGEVPLTAPEYHIVEEMAAALRGHPVAGPLLSTPGEPEQSLFWQDDEYGIWRRARFDWYPKWSGAGRLIIPDYKTTVSAAPARCRKAMCDHGYHLAADWYLAGARALGLADDAAFVWVFQEKTPPYLVTVAEPSYDVLRAARTANETAMRVYHECTITGTWPGYADGEIVELDLPPWEKAQ